MRVINEDDLRSVTPDARAKTHFVIVDCVGVTEMDIADTQPLERKRNVSFKALLDHVAMGGADPDVLSSLASRLARLERSFGPDEDRQVAAVADGSRLGDIASAIIEALDPDVRIDRARESFGLAEDIAPTAAQLARTRGSHRQFHHPIKPGTVTVAGKSILDIPPGTLNSILKQAGLKQEGERK